MPKNVRKIFLTGEQPLPAPSGRSRLLKWKYWCLLLSKNSSTDWYCLWSLQPDEKISLCTHYTWKQKFIQAPDGILIYMHSATATLLSITFPTDQQTLFGACGSILRYKLRKDLGVKRESTAAVVLLGGFPPSETLAMCMFCPANTYLQQRLSAHLLSGTQFFGMWDPALLACLLSSIFLTAPGHREC